MNALPRTSAPAAEGVRGFVRFESSDTVPGYEDHVTVTLDTVDKVSRISRVRLAPTIRVAPGTDPSEVLMEPTIEEAR